MTYIPKLKKDGTPKFNSAWTLNTEIWNEVVNGNLKQQGLSNRYVSIYNFEFANNYRQDKEKGKPLSAYEYVKNIDNIEKPKILEFVNQIVGVEDRDIIFTQEELEEIVNEPK